VVRSTIVAGEHAPVPKHHASKAYRGSAGTAPGILTSALDRREWLTSRSGRSIPEKQPHVKIGREAGCALESKTDSLLGYYFSSLARYATN
jgi:hypothetical protein